MGGHRYDKDGNPIYDETGRRSCDHAHSRAEAVRIINEAAGCNINVNELKNYWNEGCWGRTMDGIKEELGVWTQQSHNHKPVRIWPKDGETNE